MLLAPHSLCNSPSTNLISSSIPHSGREEDGIVGWKLGAVGVVGCLDVFVTLHLQDFLLLVHLLLNPTDARVLVRKKLRWPTTYQHKLLHVSRHT